MAAATRSVATPPSRAATIVQVGRAPEAASSPRKKSAEAQRGERREPDRCAARRAPLGVRFAGDEHHSEQAGRRPDDLNRGRPVALHHARRHRTRTPRAPIVATTVTEPSAMAL